MPISKEQIVHLSDSMIKESNRGKHFSCRHWAKVSGLDDWAVYRAAEWALERTKGTRILETCRKAKADGLVNVSRRMIKRKGLPVRTADRILVGEPFLQFGGLLGVDKFHITADPNNKRIIITACSG